MLTLCMLNPHSISFRHYALISISLFHLTVKLYSFNGCRRVEWWVIIGQTIVQFDSNFFHQCLKFVMQYKICNFCSPIFFNLSLKQLFKIGKFTIASYFSQRFQFDTPILPKDVYFSQVIYIWWYWAEYWLKLPFFQVQSVGSPCILMFVNC